MIQLSSDRVPYLLHLDNLRQQHRAANSACVTPTLVMTMYAARSLSLEGAFVRALGNVWCLLQVQGELRMVQLRRSR